MNYETIKLDKTMYKNAEGFSAQLEQLDPSARYSGTELAALDAFQRQLKRFDIKVSGPNSSTISKFFNTSDAAALFPEYVSRAVAQGAQEAGVLEELVASKTDISSPDYRSITTSLSSTDFSDTVAEGAAIPEINITLNSNLVSLVKRGRVLNASYEAIKFQRADIMTVSLKQIGTYLAKQQLKDAVSTLITGHVAAESLTSAASTLAYADLLKLWGKFDDFEMNVMLASPDMVADILSLAELKDPISGLHFQSTGSFATPLGAKLLKSVCVPAGTVIALDRRFALEMVTAGGISVEYDKLIDSQLERAAITSTYGFSKIFPDAVKVLKRKA